MTGFRVSRGRRAAALYGVRPDLVTFGKVIGGGLPVGAFGGRADVMDRVAPAGPNLPGGHALREPDGDGRRASRRSRLMTAAAYGKLEAARGEARRGARRARRGGEGAGAGEPGRLDAHRLLLGEAGVRRGERARRLTKRFGAFFHRMLEGGVYLPPSQFEAAFLSTAHSAGDIEQTLLAAEAAFAEAAKVV